jgi:glutamine synthetase
MEFDTVAVAVPDATGRLIGKRLTAEAWERVRESGEFSMPDFHLITGLENEPIAGMRATGAQNGFPDGVLRPDMSSWRSLPWDAGTGLVICDAHQADGAPSEHAPRWILRRQVEALAARGLVAGVASELEFYLLRTSYAAVAESRYRRLRAAYHRGGDNDLLVDGVVEPLLGDVRRLMPAAGIPIELSQGEGGIGQFEVTLRYSEPLAMADRHVVYKHGVKALAQRHGVAATFLAKLSDDQPGSSCHIHLSLRRDDGACALSGDHDGLSPLGRAFVAGVLALAPELCLLFAPYANSYRRLQPGSWAPANVTWGVDNRTCLVRVCGEAGSRRVEFRLPGADANPYLAYAGLIAAGLRGIAGGLEPSPPITGDAYAVDATMLPRDIAEAVDRFSHSTTARDALGSQVHEHVAALGRHERDVTRREVTDRDLVRGFEVA